MGSVGGKRIQRAIHIIIDVKGKKAPGLPSPGMIPAG